MAVFGDNWIRVFDIPETSKHVKGFTLYKIVSIVYPKNCPDAVTKVTVWKRYNDFKRLHRELKLRHKSMHIQDKYPSLLSSSYFKRFDPEIIDQRRNSILSFLDYIGIQPSLFKSIEFVKFFETGHTPQESLNSNINIIRAQLNLPGDPEIFHPVCKSDNEAHSDSDTASSFSSISASVVQNDEININEQKPLVDSTKKLGSTQSISTISKISSPDSVSNHSFHYSSVDSGSVSYPTPPLTPENVTVEKNSMQYLADAAQYITQAAEFELEKKYEEAFSNYKLGISKLLNGVKGDSDSNRRQMVRHKTEKYLLRAEKIYNLHLSPEINQLKQSISKSESVLSKNFIKKPLVQLFEYKVLKIIDRGMVVLHKQEHIVFYMKVIQKYAITPESVFINIPKDIPHMVKLFQYYDSVNALFIVTEYVNGKRLFDSIQEQQEIISHDAEMNSEQFEFQDDISFSEAHSDSSEYSYSDLISDYASNKNDSKENSMKKVESDISISSNILSPTDNTSDFAQDVVKSQQLSLVDETPVEKIQNDKMDVKQKLAQRKYSEKSFSEEFSCVKYIPSAKKVVKWASQLLLALDKLHSFGVIIVDLNPRNLLLDCKDDLILTFMFNFQRGVHYCNVEKNNYCAPEVFGVQNISFAVDWWSYGVILFELLTGLPLKFVHPQGLKSHTILKIPKYVSAEAKSLLRQLLMFDPHDRLGCGSNGIEDLKSHPFFASVNWNQLMQ